MQARLVACFLLVVSAADVAAQDRRCGSASWSLGRPINLFDEPLPTVRDAHSLPKEGVFRLSLKPVSDVLYPVAPEQGSDGGNGAAITIERVSAGRYEIALSEDAWVDAVQSYKRLPLLPHPAKTECRGVRQRLLVVVGDEPLTLQIGGTIARQISIAVTRIWDMERRL